MKRSLKSKFVAAMCLITIVVLMLTSVVTLAMSIKIFQRSTEASMEQLAMIGRLQVDNWFGDKEQMLYLIGDELGMYAPGQGDEIAAYLSRYMQGQYPYIVDIYVVTPDNQMYSAIGSVPPGIDWHTRDWYYEPRQQGGLVYTSPYISTDPGTPMIITLSIPATGRNRSDMGVLVMDIELNSLIALVNDDRIMETSGRAFLLDESGDFIAHENPAFLPRIIGDMQEEFTSFHSVGIARGRELSGGTILLSKGKDWDGVQKYIATVTVERNQWVYGFSVPTKDFYGIYVHLFWIWGGMVVVMIALAVALSSYMSRRLLVPINTIIHTASRLAEGDMDISIHVETGDELEALSGQFNRMIQSNSQQILALQRLAEGDFTVSIEPKSDKDSLSITLNQVIEQLCSLLGDINHSIGAFAAATVEISDASNQLSYGTQEQSAAVRQLSEALDRILTNTRENAEHARSASETIQSVRRRADSGSSSMENMVQAVEQVSQTTSNITKIIKVIEDLAFQTNILALNAAVEAARAGQNGKGFAVVADEVRTLANHSAQAANEITALIQGCSQAADNSVEIAQKTQKILSDIVQRVGDTANIVEKIDTVLAKQVQEVDQIAASVTQIDQVVQQNTATAQETAATSVEMSAQAQMMEDNARIFRVGAQHTPPPAAIASVAGTTSMALNSLPAFLEVDSKY